MTTIRDLRRPWLTAALWLAANVIGFGLVGAYFHNFPLAFSFPPDFSGLWRLQPWPGLLAGLGFGLVPALLIGLAQWMLLRRLLAPSRWWIITVSAGMGLQHFLDDSMPHARDRSLAVLAAAVLTGYLQMRLLRGRVASPGWWLAAASGSWFLGWGFSVTLLDGLGWLQRAWVPGLTVQQHGLQGLVVGALYGVLTSLVLVRASPASPQPSNVPTTSNASPAPSPL